MMIKGLVSIIIPAYNAAAFIEDAIASVLAQDYRPIEVIVIDDGSTDQTASISARFGSPVACYRQHNAGAPAARNRGLMMARGEYIGFLDADDVYEPGRVRLQLGKLQQSPNVAVVMGRLVREQIIDRPGKLRAFAPVQSDDHVTLQMGLGLFRKPVFEQVGMMEESLLHSDDWDWFMRARELGVPILLHEDIVMRARLHRSNMTRDRRAGVQFLSIMLKRSIDRRRGMGQAQSLAKLVEYREISRREDNGKK